MRTEAGPASGSGSGSTRSQESRALEDHPRNRRCRICRKLHARRSRHPSSGGRRWRDPRNACKRTRAAQSSLEAAGVEFIEDSGGGEGVRFSLADGHLRTHPPAPLRNEPIHASSGRPRSAAIDPRILALRRYACPSRPGHGWSRCSKPTPLAIGPADSRIALLSIVWPRDIADTCQGINGSAGPPSPRETPISHPTT
jgi:hypothetical protein